MAKDQNADQPNLFDKITEEADLENIILYGLGEFQLRGFDLIDRRLAFDRLRWAFKRAAESFGLAEFSDGELAIVLEKLGANVEKIPTYVAKHPFRVTVDTNLAIRASEFYQNTAGAKDE